MRQRVCPFCKAAFVAILALTACRDRSAAPAYGGPPEPQTSAVPSNSQSLVQSYLEKKEPHHAGKIKIHRDGVPNLPLAGVDLWFADIVIPDGWTYACFVQGESVWCTDEDKALERLVRAQGLGKQPTKLNDAQWIDLVRFVMKRALIVSTGEEAKRYLSGAPDAATSRVAAPRVTRSDGRLVVQLYFLRVANDTGPIGLSMRELTIASDDSVTLKDESLFETGQ